MFGHTEAPPARKWWGRRSVRNLPPACSNRILAQTVPLPTGNPHAARRGKKAGGATTDHENPRPGGDDTKVAKKMG